MNIKFNGTTKEVKIEELDTGDTFINADEVGYLEPDVFMVIDEPSILLTRKSDENHDMYALNLENGRVIGFYNKDEVVPVNCDLNVTIK